MIRKITAPLAGLFLFASPALAQQAASATPAVQDADPAMWVVKDDDTTIYLFGTFHALKPGLSWFDDAVRQAFDKSDTAVFEIDTSDTAAIQAAAMKYGISKQAEPFTARMTAKQKATYEAALQKLGVPPTALDRMKPWLAGVTLTTLGVQKAGFDPKQGAEATLVEAAKQAGKRIDTLETADQQLGFFDSLSEEEQIRFLVETAEEMDEPAAMLDRMIRYWAAGAPEELGKLINDELTASPDLAKILLYDRNERWAHQIKAMLDKPGTVFIAVGAGHLAGPKDVQADLAKLGVKATRVDYD
ncbi:TraB/GumN family protein [Stakelama sp. CBK3Z-3]|uniref:TraB/GumN family protein n=1 Tax=Stakelama flava TaxID=2860338 RepID=A0ABS6XMS2_9SPHN|nr:TraB/GumN family protein [Stakelama flava]MBW4331507.1 TraB/GumN family protein [Stakelama flava]